MLRDSFDEGLSISEIARQTGYDRNTIRKYINSETPPMRNRRSRDPGKIAPFKEYIISRLNEHPLTATRIYREIQEKGFTGKYGIVKNFIREVRPKIEVPPDIDMRQSPAFRVKWIGPIAAKSRLTAKSESSIVSRWC